MKVARYLAQLGYGTRRQVEHLLWKKGVTHENGAILTDRDEVGPKALAHEHIRVHGEPLDPPPDSVILLHKPAGFVCSTEDRNPLVYDLMPARFRHRNPVIAPVGRLDRDTTGLLLLTDNGALLHRLTSPRSHLTKTYRAALAEPVSEQTRDLLESGTLLLHGEEKPLLPARLEQVSERDVRVTITEGRYHQVRRMFAAAGNHVVQLHRESTGSLQLGELAEGEWRVLSASERAMLDEDLHAARLSAASLSAASPRAP